MTSTLNTRMNRDFENYFKQSSFQYGLEGVDWCLFDTIKVSNFQRGPIHFFAAVDYATMSRVQTNVQIPGMLPNPMALNVDEIRLFGIASDMMFTRLRIVIGNKLWVDRPAWTCSGGFYRCNLRKHLLIPPLVPFRGDLQWDGAIVLGQGYGGNQLVSKPIQLCLMGTLARSVC